jgi:1,4-alpha-glucan branching enzyme
MNQAYLFNQGQDYMSYNLLGSHPLTDPGGVAGYRFAVWAPAAAAVSAVGSFNSWDPGSNRLDRLGSTGIWTGFAAGARTGDRYKYQITDRRGQIVLKADPYARHSDIRPDNDSILYDPDDYVWQDGAWLAGRPSASSSYPLNIYEVHLGSWKRRADGGFMSYRDLADDLAEYVADLGYTAVELMPVMEHPLDESWGYQVTGYFAVSSRHGTPADFKYLIDRLHSRGIQVILDWVPAHFPRDTFGLARFDGTALYEHADPRLGEQNEWGTYVFDFSKLEVRSFLISNAWFWLDEFHADGLRIDAVSSMLYLNYGRSDYLPNRLGGVENLDAIALLRQLNQLICDQKPHCLMIAEEATPWPGVTRPVADGGLGFTHKWNMGWMHDTLDYMGRDFTYRRWHHNQLTFSLTYAFSERFILPLSHDEVVHGKKALIERMPGDNWRRFAGLRALLVHQLTHPGGKLIFMGGEFGQFIEWRFYESLEWCLLEFDLHRQLRDCVRAANLVYRSQPALWQNDHDWDGFAWISVGDAANSVYAYLRITRGADPLLVILNLTPDPRPGYTLHVPDAQNCRIELNSDERRFGGSGYPIRVSQLPQGPDRQLQLDLPPLCGLILTLAQTESTRGNEHASQ